MRSLNLALICVVFVLGMAPAAEAAYDDVPASHWASAAVRAVAEDNDYMTFSGTEFHPAWSLTRRVFARAVVKAFSQDMTVDPELEFSDLPATDPWFKYANIAVSRGWMVAEGGAFEPSGTVSKRSMDRTLVRALGLLDAVRGLSRIKESSGEGFKLPSAFPYLVIAGNLRLHYNHPTGPDEQYELYPWETATRADGAYALWKAKQAQGSWMMNSLSGYATITLPSMSDARHRAVEFAFAYAGYPYVYAGEWYRRTPDAYCCGTQAQGGFDCSGYLWWVLKKPGGGFDNTHVRPYGGWALPERASYQMAAATEDKIALDELKPLDIVMFDSDDSGTGASSVDHAGMALGNGWMIHSSGGRSGVTMDRVGDGWWADHYVWGRRITSS